jgi:hypothetical protein
VATLRRRRFHVVVSLCDRVREVLPDFSGRPRVVHWSLPDPAREAGDPVAAYRRTAAELDCRIRYLLPALRPAGPTHPPGKDLVIEHGNG